MHVFTFHHSLVLAPHFLKDFKLWWSSTHWSIYLSQWSVIKNSVKVILAVDKTSTKKGITNLGDFQNRNIILP